MLDRLLPGDIFRAHWKALSDYTSRKPVPDKATRAVVVALPVGAFVASLVFDFTLQIPEGVLAALALLAGGFLTAFTHLSPVRVHLAEREDTWGDAERFDRDAIDETSAHLLAGAYVAGIATVALVLGMNFGAGEEENTIVGFWAALSAGLMTYVVLIFLITLPRLYQAYAKYAKVRAALDGTHRSKL
ncbi:hypothetical protein [Cellulosimicrobium sp. NPDC057862]|uniref:hypothetical protein n=1 Tax=Actinomycetes TaxID=1760 RepID=UPI0036719607